MRASKSGFIIDYVDALCVFVMCDSLMRECAIAMPQNSVVMLKERDVVIVNVDSKTLAKNNDVYDHCTVFR